MVWTCRYSRGACSKVEVIGGVHQEGIRDQIPFTWRRGALKYRMPNRQADPRIAVMGEEFGVVPKNISIQISSSTGIDRFVGAAEYDRPASDC